MDDKNVVRELRSWKRDGHLGQQFAQLRTLLDRVTDPSVLEKVGHVLKDVSLEQWEPVSMKTCKIAVLSNFTCDSVPHYLRAYGLRYGIWPTVYKADFNQYIYQLLNPESELYSFSPDITLCLLDEHALFDELDEEWGVDDVAKAAETKLEQLEQLIQTFSQHNSGMLVLNSVPLSVERHQSVLDYKSKAKLSKEWRVFNAHLMGLAEKHKSVLVLDTEVLLPESGAKTLRDPRLSYYAGMQLSEEILAAMTHEAIHVSRSLLGMTKKCMVLDLDNTLWGGIIGDDGLHGIQLGDDVPGKVYVDFQKNIKRLSKQGILLAINSKNEKKNVLEAFQNHPNMVIREDDCVMIVANWDPKHENILAMKKALNIGIDSFVFFDDSPFEREMVRRYTPEVTVPELPADPTGYVRTLLSGGWFNTIELTQEDQKRTEIYKQQAKREEYRTESSSLEEFLHGLEIEVDLFSPESFTLSRLTQLNMRTNQFNMTTRRYNESQMALMAKDDCYQIIGFQSRDRFGDNGIIGSVIMEKQKEDGKTNWWIRNFLMSCRVFSRGIETAVMHALLNQAREEGVTHVWGEYKPSPKNGIVKHFFTQHGFELAGMDGNTQLFRHDLADIGNCPDWIVLRIKREEVGLS